MKGDIINGYTLDTDWQVVGGMSEIAFATKGGKEWFIKKFIAPKYPVAGSPGSEKIKAQKRKTCEEFESRQKELNRRIGSKCGLGGNLVYAVDFFRVDTCYYKINEKIAVDSMAVSDICHLEHTTVLVIMKSLVHSLRILHREKIVHGDLKPDNILIKKTAGTYTTKLIDFDDSYFSGNPPREREMVVGTPEYYSPELYDYITDEDEKLTGDILTTKSDIFALGVIFAEYLTGEKPHFAVKYNATYSAVKNDTPISFTKTSHLTSSLESLLRQMLQLNASNRPSIDEVFEILKKESTDKTEDIPTPPIVPLPQILRFEVIPDKVKKGDNVTLDWEVQNADTVRIEGEPLRCVHKGTRTLKAQPTFKLIATNSAGCTTKEVNINFIEETKGLSRLRGKGIELLKEK